MSKELITPFSIESFGIDVDKYVENIGPSFLKLAADEYDMRLGRISFLKKELPNYKDKLDDLFPDYYLGKINHDYLLDFINLLPPHQQQSFFNIKPFRKRGVARLLVNRHENTWIIEHLENKSFSQNAEGYLNLPRYFEPLDVDMINSPDYQRLIRGIADISNKQHPAKAMSFTIHHMHSFLSAEDSLVSNSPEGIHQDGSDYLVSACVIERRNIRGGVSKVYGEDKSTLLLEKCLQVGEGIFQPDRGSPLWHEVTPIQIDNVDESFGHRSIIGVDIEILDDSTKK